MENKKHVSGSSSSLEHLFSPKDYFSSSSSTTSDILWSIFSPPPTGRDSGYSGIKDSWDDYQGFPKHGKFENQVTDHTTDSKGQSSGITSKDKSSSIYQNQTSEPCYFSSSIYYGGQENYSPSKKTTEAPQYFKKEGEEDDLNRSNSSGASRGNWWQGSLYY